MNFNERIYAYRFTPKTHNILVGGDKPRLETPYYTRKTVDQTLDQPERTAYERADDDVLLGSV
jgi:hypothetical protein